MTDKYHHEMLLEILDLRARVKEIAAEIAAEDMFSKAAWLADQLYDLVERERFLTEKYVAYWHAKIDEEEREFDERA